jgi:hypothetical protein
MLQKNLKLEEPVKRLTQHRAKIIGNGAEKPKNLPM